MFIINWYKYEQPSYSTSSHFRASKTFRHKLWICPKTKASHDDQRGRIISYVIDNTDNIKEEVEKKYQNVYNENEEKFTQEGDASTYLFSAAGELMMGNITLYEECKRC